MGGGAGPNIDPNQVFQSFFQQFARSSSFGDDEFTRAFMGGAGRGFKVYSSGNGASFSFTTGPGGFSNMGGRGGVDPFQELLRGMH